MNILIKFFTTVGLSFILNTTWMLILSFIISLIWNYTISPMFSLPEVTWYQTCLISIVTHYFLGPTVNIK